jgi:hypothetical protein
VFHSLAFFVTINPNTGSLEDNRCPTWDVRSVAIGNAFVVAHPLDSTDLRIEEGRFVTFEQGYLHEESTFVLSFRTTKPEMYCLYMVGKLARQSPRFLISCPDPSSSWRYRKQSVFGN